LIFKIFWTNPYIIRKLFHHQIVLDNCFLSFWLDFVIFWHCENYVIENMQTKNLNYELPINYKVKYYAKCIFCSAWTAGDTGFPHSLLKVIEKNDESTNKLSLAFKYMLSGYIIIWSKQLIGTKNSNFHNEMMVKSLRDPWRSKILSNRANSFFYSLVGVWSYVFA
jgi:hypothetical protein